MLDHRTNILLTKDEFKQLSNLSKSQNKTISQLTRHALRKTYNLDDRTSRQELMSRIDTVAIPVSTAGEYQEYIDHGKKY